MYDDEPLVPGEFKTYVLPPDQWEARRGELPYATLPDPGYTLLVVVENHEGRIVASWMAMNTVHLEGLHVVASERHKGSVSMLLLNGMLQALAEGQVPAVLTLAQEPSIITLAQKFGFRVVPGTLLQLDLRKGY
jgi:hypothetical protein